MTERSPGWIPATPQAASLVCNLGEVPKKEKAQVGLSTPLPSGKLT